MDQSSIPHHFGSGLAIIAPVFIVLYVVVPQAVRMLREYEHEVVVRPGKLPGAKGPVIDFLFPTVDRLVRMDLRVGALYVSGQEIMTQDNVPATVGAAGYFRVINPRSAGIEPMIGKTVNALSRIDSPGGRVFIEGEYWNAASETPVEAGPSVEITGIEGLTLKVKLKQG